MPELSVTRTFRFKLQQALALDKEENPSALIRKLVDNYYNEYSDTTIEIKQTQEKLNELTKKRESEVERLNEARRMCTPDIEIELDRLVVVITKEIEDFIFKRGPIQYQAADPEAYCEKLERDNLERFSNLIHKMNNKLFSPKELLTLLRERKGWPGAREVWKQNKL